MPKNGKELPFKPKRIGREMPIIDQVIYLTQHDLFIRFYGGDVRVCDMSQFFEPEFSKQYFTLPEFKQFSYTDHDISWGNGEYKIGADTLFDCSHNYNDVFLKFKKAALSKKEQPGSDTKEYHFDFSDVDFVTHEGGKNSFDSVEEAEAYFDAYSVEEYKFRKAHPGIVIQGDEDEDILNFTMTCNEFCDSISDINIKFIDALLSRIDADEPFALFKNAIAQQNDHLPLLRDKLNNSLRILNELRPNIRRSRDFCAGCVHSAFDSIEREFRILKFYLCRIREMKHKSGGIVREIYELLVAFTEKCLELAGIMDDCEFRIEALLDVWIPVFILKEEFAL